MRLLFKSMMPNYGDEVDRTPLKVYTVSTTLKRCINSNGACSLCNVESWGLLSASFGSFRSARVMSSRVNSREVGRTGLQRRNTYHYQGPVGDRIVASGRRTSLLDERHRRSPRCQRFPKPILRGARFCERLVQPRCQRVDVQSHQLLGFGCVTRCQGVDDVSVVVV